MPPGLHSICAVDLQACHFLETTERVEYMGQRGIATSTFCVREHDMPCVQLLLAGRVNLTNHGQQMCCEAEVQARVLTFKEWVLFTCLVDDLYCIVSSWLWICV